jgi:hypothetical protein
MFHYYNDVNMALRLMEDHLQMINLKLDPHNFMIDASTISNIDVHDDADFMMMMMVIMMMYMMTMMMCNDDDDGDDGDDTLCA